MNELFELYFKMSLQATLLIGVVMVIRVFTGKLPKLYNCILWGLVLIRLLCPVFIESSISLSPQAAGKAMTAFLAQSERTYIENLRKNTGNSVNDSPKASGKAIPSEAMTSGAMLSETMPSGAMISGAVPSNQAAGVSKGSNGSVWDILYLIWAVGTVGMAFSQLLRYIRMRKLLRTAVRTAERVWECEGIGSPFVMGCIRPRIYLPFGITGKERTFIISHERSHIRHFDPQLRVMEIAALCIHWWNPFVWLAIYTMNKDREMLCDEAVLKNADMDTRKEYSGTLLQFEMKQSKVEFMVAFGESNTERRIKNILKYHKPSVAVKVVLTAVVVVCAVCFLTVPRIKANADGTGKEGTKNHAEEASTQRPIGSTDPNISENMVKDTENEESSLYTAQQNTTGTGTQKNETDTDTQDNILDIGTGLLDEKEYAALIIECLKEDNQKFFSSLIQYPIQVFVKDQRKVIYNEEEFQSAYDDIVNESFKSAVLSSYPDGLQDSPMYGIGMGNGSIWFEKFESAGYQIYCINNSEGEVYTGEDQFQESWADRTGRMNMEIEEGEAWYARIIEDFPHAEESYKVQDGYYEDLDRNGVRDLVLLLRIRDGVIVPDSYAESYLCIYMNDDSVYDKACAGYYFGLSQVLHGDVDQDGYTEIICSIFTGGNGGNGSAEKSILKYKDHILVPMSFPGDIPEELAGVADEGYLVKVLYGNGENKYKAVCDGLGQTVEFNGQNALYPDGSRVVRYIKEDEAAGGNCRGYTEFAILIKDGREYLLAKEFLTGEGGTSHCVGWATFLMDWDKNGTPYVLEFNVEEYRPDF